MEESGHTVLVVDDDPAIRFLCRVNLELEGCGVFEAATLDEARSHLAGGLVEVVLLDVHVGSESGVDFLEEIHRVHAGVPVAMLTGSVGTATLDDTRADAVISKPFTLEQLTGTVRDLAARGRTQTG